MPTYRSPLYLDHPSVRLGISVTGVWGNESQTEPNGSQSHLVTTGSTAPQTLCDQGEIKGSYWPVFGTASHPAGALSRSYSL